MVKEKTQFKKKSERREKETRDGTNSTKEDGGFKPKSISIIKFSVNGLNAP